MPKTFKGDKVFATNFDVQYTEPLDTRLVVDSYDDLTNGSIEAPYQGMVVNIAGTSELWVLKTSTIAESHERENWELVTGVAIDGGNGLSKYSIPVMTSEMVEEATLDPDVDFDGSENPYIHIEYDTDENEEVHENMYPGLLTDMLRAIRSLQAEVARLRNSFDYGIDSYKDTKTAKSVQLGLMEDVETTEPLWAIDPGYLSLVPDDVNFNTILGQHHSFTWYGPGSIDVSVEDQLTFDDCTGVFYDGKKTSGDTYEDLTLYKLTDSKLITYLVTNKPDIRMNLWSIDDKTKTRTVDFAPLLRGNTVKKYGFCTIISRKVKNSDDTEKGFNYIYFSIIDYDNDRKLYEGYLTNGGLLTDRRVDLNERYSIQSIEFDNLTLSRMKFYTKFEDFSEEVITSAPSESDYKYEVAHIAIRSVANTQMLNEVADHLKDNELIWNKKSGTLHIKSDGKIYLIGSNSVNPDDDEHNNDDNMTDREIVEALERMGIIINVEYKKDSQGYDTDEIESLSNMSLAPISDITFVNAETEKRFTFSVDTEGNLICKDNSDMTIKEFLENTCGVSDDYYDPESYQAVRGFSSEYLFRKEDPTISDILTRVNSTTDVGKPSDRLRIASFYAPLTTDDKHGCTHSFIELENSSNVDIPLKGVYLHFFNPTENNYDGQVHHLALDGVIPAGGTYLIRGAKHAEFDDESTFIKVKTFDKEWYENGQPVSFEQIPVENMVDDNGTPVDASKKKAYRFCLTYGLPDLEANRALVNIVTSGTTQINGVSYKSATFPNIILTPRFIDSCAYSSKSDIAKLTGADNPWYANGGGVGIQIKPNTMFRLMFELDPAKQAFNAFNKADTSRIRYNSNNDLQVLSLDQEFIGFPNSKEIIKIERYTPKASFEHRNIMTDKSQLNREKPNMVTCSFGVDVYNTRCFNWISCGTFDENVWIRQKQTDSSQPENPWVRFSSYTKLSEAKSEGTGLPRRKEYTLDVNNAVYARLINRFPGNDVLFTSHKCVIVLPDVSTPTVYEYVVGRPDKDGKPDSEHTNSVYTFTLYPRTYEGRVYQVTDQQGFHWIEYQVWAASAEFLNKKIDEECAAINSGSGTKVFPILINTGDMTQSGARINEWLDYYNGGVCLFDHLEQMNCVGNNDLCPINPRDLGTGNDDDKSSSQFFHYFYCFDVKDDEQYAAASEDNKKFFTGETLVVKAHSGEVIVKDNPVAVTLGEDKYIPSVYYFKTKGAMYVVVNSEIPITNVQSWFKLISPTKQYVNIYTGIECIANGTYAGNMGYFTPVYETLYAWLNSNQDGNNKPIKKVVVAMHEMPFTVITNASLINTSASNIPCTRNHPTNGSRLGSNVNQLTSSEKRGIYWCSRLLEAFNCKLVIGGHKHTYALSYPIKEKYCWTSGELDGENNKIWYDSETNPKVMGPTLADEAVGGTNEVSWEIVMNSTNKIDYNVTVDVNLNSTKTPYIPEELFNNYGLAVYNKGKSSNLFRCCTPTAQYNDKYDNFVTYSMCQATGFKLKSNKELPSATQVFSKIIPETVNNNPGNSSSSDSPSKNQLYPMYSVLQFNNDYSELDVTMNRITGVFQTDGADKFAQGVYGNRGMKNQVLCTYEKEDYLDSKHKTSFDYVGTKAEMDYPPAATDATEGNLYYATDEDVIYECLGENTVTGVIDWAPITINNRMYGVWLNEDNTTVDGFVIKGSKNRLAEYLANPTSVSDNRYLHIKF